MKAILQYVQKIIASGKDGTICAMIDTGEVATLTVKKRSIVAASLAGVTGKQALEAIKLANIAHMEFWMGIIQTSDIQKMIRIQAETNALSPIPEEEMHPEGAPLVLDDEESEDSRGNEPSHSQMSSEVKHHAEEAAHLTEQDAESLTTALTAYIGPAAGILVEGFIEQAHDIDHLIELLSDELFSDKERAEFANKAYFLLSQKS